MADRTRPAFSLQAKLLEAQGFRCGYCLFPFGSVVRRREPEITVVHWDHFVPYSYLDSNPENNWVAACQFCNSLKSNLWFETLERARLYILDRWTNKGYETLWVPSVSSEEDTDAWSREYQETHVDLEPVVRLDVEVEANLRLGGSARGRSSEPVVFTWENVFRRADAQIEWAKAQKTPSEPR